MSDATPAGWYPDTNQPGTQRYYDGAVWTDHTTATVNQPTPKGGFPKWLIPVIACLGLAFVAAIGGAIAGTDDDTEGAASTVTTDPTTGQFARCNDGEYSDNGDLTAICSSHDGVAEFLAEYGECDDGTVVALRDEPECPNGGNLTKLLPGYVPEAADGDIALCSDGTYSDNRDLLATCSSHDGVDEWLADYGRCVGGDVVRLIDDPRCPAGENLDVLLPDYTPPTTTEPPPTTAPPTTAAPATPPPPPPPPPAESVSQANARESAESYLSFSAFSRTGLIDQLKFEGFSEGDATYGVDAQNADWNEQAAKSAASYLEFSSFSRQGLIDQLVFEGFTQAEAEYGVSTTGL